jgi:hypothetical protein
MAISFPSSPTLNQTYTYNNKTWQWNGSQWDAVGSIASVSVTSPITNSGSAINPTLGLATTLPSVTSVNGTTIPSSATLLTSTSTTINGSTVPASDTLVGRATTDTLTNKTLTSPVVNYGTANELYLTAPMETWVVYNGQFGASGSTFDVLSGAVLYATTSQGQNFNMNIRGNGSTTVNSLLSVGQTLTATLMITNGTTGYYLTSLLIDGTTVTPKWSGGSAPSSGNASGVDVYQFSILKTASATFTVFASGPVKYA